jgi:hypothetical protein
MGWLVGRTPAQVNTPSSRTWWCKRTNWPLTFGSAFVCSLVTGFLDTRPLAEMPAASGIGEDSGWVGGGQRETGRGGSSLFARSSVRTRCRCHQAQAPLRGRTGNEATYHGVKG